MKKIGFVITTQGWGGLEINVLKLIKWLTERNWEITLYTVNHSRLYQEAIRCSIPVCIINKHKKYLDISAAYHFSKIIRKDKLRTIMIFDNIDMDFIFLTKKFLSNNTRVIYQQHMQMGVKKKDIIHTLRFSAINEWISPLHILKKEVQEKTKVKPDKIKVIPLGTEIEKFIHRKYTREEARKKLNIDPSVTLLGIMGRIDPKKGQLFLIKAFDELQKKRDNMALLIVGSPTLNDEKCKDYYTYLKDYVFQHNLSEKVIFTDHLEDVPLFYNAIDLFALATEGETYGMVTIEAMLSGVPIIATNSGGTPEILNYGELGYLYTPHDLVDFRSKIEKMLRDKAETQEIARKAQQSAIRRFSHIHECELLEDLLCELRVGILSTR